MAKLLSGTRIYGTATVDTLLYVSGTATATSTITGAVVVTGGVGIGGALYAGSIYSNGTLIGSSVSTTTTDTFFINNATASTSTITGALRVLGGAGIGGQVNIFTTLTVGPVSLVTLPNTVAQFSCNVNSYGQIHVQNISAGAAASTDFILTKDTGNDTTGFLDLGINNSGFSQAGIFDVVSAGSGYLYVNGGDLALGTDGAYTVRIFAGGTLAANEQVRINTTGMGIKTTSPSGVLDVNGNQVINIVAVPILNIDCSLGNYFTITIAAVSTLTFSNPPASRAYAFTLEVTYTSGSITWPTTVQWPSGTTPTITAGKTQLFVFVTNNAGTRWRGAAAVDYTN